MPRRSELDPGALKPILPYLSLLEVRAPETLVYRLAGTAIRDMLGAELTNRNLLDFSPAKIRRRIAWRVWTVTSVPCGATYETSLTYPGGGTNTHEGLSLPLEPDRPDAPPLLVRVFAPIQGPHWLNQPGMPLRSAVTAFTFLDIGAGIPDTIDPPGDFVYTG